VASKLPPSAHIGMGVLREGYTLPSHTAVLPWVILAVRLIVSRIILVGMSPNILLEVSGPMWVAQMMVLILIGALMKPHTLEYDFSHFSASSADSFSRRILHSFPIIHHTICTRDNKGGKMPMLLEAGLKVFLLSLSFVHCQNNLHSRVSGVVRLGIKVSDSDIDDAVGSTGPKIKTSPQYLPWVFA
jgi:hypothetical protein